MNRAAFPKPVEVDLMLVFPPFQRLVVSMENIGIAYIAAAAREAGFSAAMINAGLNGLGVEEIAAILRRSRFRVLGVSTSHWTMPAALAISRAAKESNPSCHIVFGGVEAALDAERILRHYPFVDSIGLGEGERTVPALLSALAGGREIRDIEGLACRDGVSIRHPRAARLIEPLDELPFAARDDMAAVLDAGGAVSMSSSRGCPGRCAFCSVRAFYGLSEGAAWRGRSPSSVVAEMLEIQERYGARRFSFIDETVVGPGKNGIARLRELAARIREAGLTCDFFMTVRAEQVDKTLFRELKAAGLRKVEIGIESMAASQLKRFGKRAGIEDNRRALRTLEELGIAVELFMVPFDPGVTPDELTANLHFYRRRFAARSGYDVSPLSLGNYLCPYPGTETRRVYEQHGWLDADGRAPFRAEGGRMQKVGDVLIRLADAVEPAFPMSYLGLGNLWINSAGLSGDVYGRICAMCAEIGEILTDVAEWTLSVTARPLPLPIGEIEGLIVELRRFLGRLASLRKELCGIVSTCGDAGAAAGVIETGNPFARELHALGRQRKREIFDAEQGREPEEYDIITAVLDILTKEASA
jgi:radical SAM superfamily enzyme YgiQ (UPF0313 family)